MPTVVITGANRGIGLALARLYAVDGWRVVATCRDPARADELKTLGGNVVVRSLDVTDDASVALLAEGLARQPVDLLINNAGLLGPEAGRSVDDSGRGQALEDIDFDAWMDVLQVNTLGPLRVARALLANLERGERPVILTLTSQMGSIARVRYGGWYAYRSSKAAVNMVTRILAEDLRVRRIAAVVVNPGWAQTDMGGSAATLPVERSAQGISALAARLTLEDTGRFFDHDGKELPW